MRPLGRGERSDQSSETDRRRLLRPVCRIRRHRQTDAKWQLTADARGARTDLIRLAILVDVFAGF
jgi:hypothetical protein